MSTIRKFLELLGFLVSAVVFTTFAVVVDWVLGFLAGEIAYVAFTVPPVVTLAFLVCSLGLVAMMIWANMFAIRQVRADYRGMRSVFRKRISPLPLSSAGVPTA